MGNKLQPQEPIYPHRPQASLFPPSVFHQTYFQPLEKFPFSPSVLFAHFSATMTFFLLYHYLFFFFFASTLPLCLAKPPAMPVFSSCSENFVIYRVFTDLHCSLWDVPLSVCPIHSWFTLFEERTRNLMAALCCPCRFTWRRRILQAVWGRSLLLSETQRESHHSGKDPKMFGRSPLLW